MLEGYRQFPDLTVQVGWTCARRESDPGFAEAMAALGQFITGVSPLVEQGTLPFEAAQAMLLTIVRKFRFGTEVEDQIKEMKPPQPKEPPADPGAEAEKARAEADVVATQAKSKADAEKLTMEMEFAREKHAMEMAELKAKGEYNQLMAQLKAMETRRKIAEAQAKALAQATALPPVVEVA
jgi:hypothetical protein